MESVIFMSGSVLEHIGGGCGGYYNVPTSYEWYYGAFADCTALKEIIIPSSVTKIDIAAFADCTADEQGINVPEIYYLLGNIYNDPMHVDNKSNKLITQTLYSRLENATVRNMIKMVKDHGI